MSETPCKCIVLLIKEFESHKIGTLLHTNQQKGQELVASGVATDNPETVSAELGRIDFSDPNQDSLKDYP